MIVPIVLLLAVISAICWLLWKMCKFLASLDQPASTPCEHIKQGVPEKPVAEPSKSTSILPAQSIWAIGIVMTVTIVGIFLGYRQKDWLGIDTWFIICLVAAGLSSLFAKSAPTEQKGNE